MKACPEEQEYRRRHLVHEDAVPQILLKWFMEALVEEHGEQGLLRIFKEITEGEVVRGADFLPFNPYGNPQDKMNHSLVRNVREYLSGEIK